MAWLSSQPDGVTLSIRVTPRSSRNRIDGPVGDALKIRLNAPPVEGKANETLVEFLAETLGLPRRAVRLEAGAQTRLKRVRIMGLDANTVEQRLLPRGAS
jgi:uncharacterized protein (TIGR00251 family)